ncbi:MAG: aminoacyl-tRNA hydrolase [bacterium JZ-2024 1]
MKAVFGLGNPGSEYENTRHNIGFRVLKALEAVLPAPERVERRRYYRSWLYRLSAQALWRVCPTTYMNRSGFAVRAFLRAHPGLGLENILVVCDDLALPLGSIRIRPKGSPGGHRGLESISNLLETTAFARLRIGIRPPHLDFVPGKDYVDFVLAPFEASEEPVVEAITETATRAVLSWATRGLQRTMSDFNASPG